MKPFSLFTFLFSLSLFAEEPALPWIVYYGTDAPITALEPYNPILIDRDYLQPLDVLLKAKKEVLGYMALGEVREQDPWFLNVKAHGILIKENEFWKGSWAVDLRHAYWKEVVLNEILPALVSRGFTGFFLDQIDIPLHLEQNEFLKYKGMKAAAIDLVQSIRKEFPHQRIMMNRAYEILPDVGDSIDYELAETLYSAYNFNTKEYFIRSKAEIDWQLAHLKNAHKQHPHLVMFSLDYWDPNDTDMYKKIYSMERSFGLRPYVSIPSLDTVIPEPKH